LEISDRIHLRWVSSDPLIIQTWELHGDEIAHEVLATEVLHSDILGSGAEIASDLEIRMFLEKV
jgi:hypothetical protein